MIRRALAALGALAVVVLAAAPPAPAQGAPTGTSAPTAALKLLSQPIAVAPDGTFPTLVGIADAPTAAELVVDIYARAQPGETVGAEPPDGPVATFEPIVLDPDGGPDRTTGFTIALYTKGHPNPDPAWGHRIDAPGVYPVRIRLQDASGNRLATMMTSLIRLPAPGEEVLQAHTALLVTVHRPPPSDPTARRATDEADASLLRQLDPVLAQLAGHASLPAAVDATPDTLARIAGDETAADTLTALRAALAGDGRVVLDAPYVDIDPASLVGAGLPGELGHQRDQGRQALRELLEEPAAGTWRLLDRVDATTLADLRNQGITRTILPAEAISRRAGILAPVDLPAGDGAVRAVATSEAYALGSDAPDDPVLAAHRLLGRLAAAGAAPDGEAPGIVVTIDPGAADDASLQILFDALQFGTPFFAAATLDDVMNGTGPVRQASATSPRPADLGRFPAALEGARADLTSYEAMVAGRNELVRPYELALAVSGSRDLALSERTRDASSVAEALREPFTAISVPVRDKVTLGTRDATFPLPVESDLAYPVQVVIELSSSDRLDFPNNRIEATLHEGRQVVPIRVRTRAPGSTPVTITVRSPDDGVTLASARYTIRSSAVSGVGIVLTVGAAAFLAAWWGRHWWRHRGTARHARRRLRRPDPPHPSPDPV